MNSTVRRLAPVCNGDAHHCVAIGLDVADAAFHTAHDFPGGVPALSQRMAMSANTLQHKVNPHNSTHHLMLEEAVKMQLVSGDKRITQAMAAAVGGVFVDMSAVPGTTLEAVTNLTKEFSDLLASMGTALADGSVSQNDMLRCEREAAELMSAANSMLSGLRAQMRGVE